MASTRDNGMNSTPLLPPAAVVGSGPNGLSAAVALSRAGFKVTVYEMHDRIGGSYSPGPPCGWLLIRPPTHISTCVPHQRRRGVVSMECVDTMRRKP
jgi:cation diffusion facilitator CzcD-associated flavoprotein CzcO